MKQRCGILRPPEAVVELYNHLVVEPPNVVAAFSERLSNSGSVQPSNSSGEIEATRLVTLAESAKMGFSNMNFDHTGLWRPLAKMKLKI